MVAPIIEEIDKAILSTKKTNDDSTDLVYRTKVTLFQFFQLKYLGGQNRDYVGFILSGSKNSNGKYQYTLKNSLIGTLNSAGIITTTHTSVLRMAENPHKVISVPERIYYEPGTGKRRVIRPGDPDYDEIRRLIREYESRTRELKKLLPEYN